MQSVDEIVKSLCPDFYASDVYASIIEQCEENTSKTFFGVLRNQAVAYKACHFYTLFSPDAGVNAGGQIASVTEGRLSISYFNENDTTTDNAFWQSSKYGKLYLWLLKSMPRANVNRLSGRMGLYGCTYQG